jgi:hypothetical protein
MSRLIDDSEWRMTMRAEDITIEEPPDEEDKR